MREMQSTKQIWKHSTRAQRGLAENHKKFAALDEEEKKRDLSEADERNAKYKADLEAFDKSAEGRKYRLQMLSFTKRRRLEELKKKFLVDQPSGRAPTAIFMFMNGMRPKVQAENPDLKGLGPIQTKLAQMWGSLSADDKKEWLDKAAEEKVEYDKKVAEFQSTENYKKYLRLSRGVMGMRAGKGKATAKVAKGKGKAKASGPAMPTKPENMPVPPKSGFQMFGEEHRSGGGAAGLKEVGKAWVTLGAEGQKKYIEKAAAAQKQYEEDMRKFRTTVEGKKYLREKEQAERKAKLSRAKERYLKETKEPKKPLSAYFIYLSKKSGEPMLHPDGKTFSFKERSDALTKGWKEMQPEEKAKYEDQAKAAKDKYDQEMVEYKNTSGYKSYQRIMNTVTGAGAKLVARAKAKKAAMLKVQAAQAAKKAAAKAGASNNNDEMGSNSSSKSSSSSSSNSD